METKEELLKKLNELQDELNDELKKTYKDDYIIYSCSKDINEIKNKLVSKFGGIENGR